MPPEFDIDFGRDSLSSGDSNVDSCLFDDVYSGFDDDPEQIRTANSQEDEPDELFFADLNDDDKISDTTKKDFLGSMENLRKNGGTTKETVASFQRAIDALKDLDPKAVEKELAAGAKDPNVRSLDVLMHLKEALEKTGFKVIAYQPDQVNGSVVLKNDKTETYVQMQFSREKGKEGASVTIENKK
ncbi:MAG: hypothetical protein K2Z81_12175 [Cyanobacteria bacterium]|nr:hypothetical protein [Cyanobacteriota bacterium]